MSAMPKSTKYIEYDETGEIANLLKFAKPGDEIELTVKVNNSGGFEVLKAESETDEEEEGGEEGGAGGTESTSGSAETTQPGSMGPGMGMKPGRSKLVESAMEA